MDDPSHSSDVYDFHSDNSDIVTDLHEDFGVSLISLLTDLSSDCPATNEYAAQQLEKCMLRSRTQEYVRNCFFRSSVPESISSTPVLFQEASNRIRLFKRLVDHFPEIISDQLIELNVDKRLKAMMIIVSVFKSADELKYSFAFRSVLSEPLFSRLITRYRDVSGRVRIEWIKMGFIVMNTSLNTNGLLEEVSRCMTDMLMRERVAEVRVEALEAVKEAILSKPHFTLDMGLIMALIHRVGDKYREIRIQAIPAVQKVYERIVQSEADHTHRYKIASSIFLLYKKTESNEEQYTIEKALYQSVFDVRAQDAVDRARNIVNAMLRCTNTAVASIGAALTRAKSLRILFMKILIARAEDRVGHQRRYIEKLAAYFDWHNHPVQTFSAIVCQIDADMITPLLRVFSDASDITVEETADTLQQLACLTDGTDMEDLYYHFLIRSCVHLNDQMVHRNLLDMIDERMIYGDDVVRCSSLLLFWMSIFDQFFEEEAVQEYLKPILQRNPQCLRILWPSKDKFKIPDHFWDACLPQDTDPSDELPDSDRRSAATSSSSTILAPEVDADDHVDMGECETGGGDNALDEAVKTMEAASLSLLGEPILSEESSTPDQSEEVTDM